MALSLHKKDSWSPGQFDPPVFSRVTLVPTEKAAGEKENTVHYYNGMVKQDQSITMELPVNITHVHAAIIHVRLLDVNIWRERES